MKKFQTIGHTFILMMVLMTVITSCSKSDTTPNSDLPVVEAYLSPGANVKVVVSQKVPYDESSTGPAANIDSLNLYIISGKSEVKLTPLGNGTYTDTLGLIKVNADSTYLLRFDYHGITVTSTTLIPTKPTSVTQSVYYIKMSQIDPDNPGGTTHPDPVAITFANADASYYLATVECMDSVLVPVIKDSIPANDMFSSMPVTGTEIDISPMMIRYFGMNRIILYHINPEYTTFFMRQASTSQSYQEPPTNIVNGFGIFTGINADTLYLNVIQI